MDLWNDNEPIGDRVPSVDVPAWIDDDISPADVAAIVQGGCSSGAYMPAVTYHRALATMAEHGDDVLQFIEDCWGELPNPPKGASWSGLACFYLSTAVEVWAAIMAGELEALEETETEEEECEHPEEFRKVFFDSEECETCGQWRTNPWSLPEEPAGKWQSKDS